MVATPAGFASAPESTTTVAPFRAWRGLPSIVARDRRGSPLELGCEAQGGGRSGASWNALPWTRWSACVDREVRQIPRSTEMAEREGFEPSIRGLAVYTLSRRAPSTARTPLRIRPDLDLRGSRAELRRSKQQSMTGRDFTAIGLTPAMKKPRRCASWLDGGSWRVVVTPPNSAVQS